MSSSTKNPTQNSGAWSNPTNAYADGGAEALALLPSGKQHVYYGFGFTIPEGATITRITVTVDERWGGCEYAGYIGHEVTVDGGSSWSYEDTYFDYYTTEEVTFSMSEYDPLWALDPVPTPAQINSDDFRVRVTAQECHVYGGQVITEEGSKNVEDVQVGDRLLADDGNYHEVTRTHHSTARQHLVINDVLRVTLRHPVFVEGRDEPIIARMLKPGLRLLSASGDPVEIEKVVLVNEGVNIVEFSVEGERYYADGFLMHNKSFPSCSVGESFSYRIDWLRVTVEYLYQKSLDETVTMTETRTATIIKTLPENPKLTEAITRVTAKVLTESSRLTELFSRVLTIIRTLTETTVLTDTLTAQRQRIFSEIMVLADTLVRSPVKRLTEAIVGSDSVIRGSIRTFSENTLLTDDLIPVIRRVLSETLVVADTLTRGAVKVLSDGVVLLDRLRMSLNGIWTALWAKQNKDAGAWTKQRKDL